MRVLFGVAPVPVRVSIERLSQRAARDDRTSEQNARLVDLGPALVVGAQAVGCCRYAEVRSMSRETSLREEYVSSPTTSTGRADAGLAHGRGLASRHPQRRKGRLDRIPESVVEGRSVHARLDARGAGALGRGCYQQNKPSSVTFGAALDVASRAGRLLARYRLTSFARPPYQRERTPRRSPTNRLAIVQDPLESKKRQIAIKSGVKLSR